MEAATIPSAATLAHWERKPPTSVEFPPLETVTRPTLTTGEAAFYLNRRPQTLRGWACAEDGPIRPRRLFGRLAWNTAEVRKLLGVQ